MKDVAVIGHFAVGKEYLDGQTIKTKIVTKELEHRFGKQNVLKVDTYGIRKKILLLPFMIMKVLKESKNIIFLPAQNGICFIAPLLVMGNILFRRRLHYIVIGAWLPEFLKNRAYLIKIIKKLDYVYVETTAMMRALKLQGFNNIEMLPNCKNLSILEETELVYTEKQPYKLCTFSRVMEEKGIEDAIEAVKYVNEKIGKVICTLDIYGPIFEKQRNWFEKIEASFPVYVKYKGTVHFDKSVNILKNYFLLIFPTRFYTEGIPGTIIDAYAAGIPVICSKWENYSDVVINNITGMGYPFGKLEELNKLLLFSMEQPEVFNDMKINCIKVAKRFTPETVMDVLHIKE